MDEACYRGEARRPGRLPTSAFLFSPLHNVASRVTARRGTDPPVVATAHTSLQECGSHCEPGPKGTGPIDGHRRLGIGTESGDKAGLPPSPLMLLFWSQVHDPLPGHWIL